jgi:hypothetical protein
MEAWLKKLGIGAMNPGVFDGTWRGELDELPGFVIASGTTAGKADVSASGRNQRFYRVLLAQ